MIIGKNKFLTVSWLSGLLSAETFVSTSEWGDQMPPLTSENSHFLRSGPQEATLPGNAERSQNHRQSGWMVAVVAEWRHSGRHCDHSMDAIGRPKEVDVVLFGIKDP